MNMKTYAIGFSFVVILQITVSSPRIVITNGPQDTTVCINAIAECYCGFSGTDPYIVIPNWRIVLRSDDGSIISNDTIDGDDIVNRFINGLQWIPDLTSGDNNAPNSKLLVGPVNMTHNHSSYQCVIELIRSDTVISSVGTMTVVDPLSVIINVDEICTTSIAITLNTINHETCGDVSHNVTISGHVIYPDNVEGPIAKYAINELESDRLYNNAVTSTHNSSSRILNKSVRTSIPKSPNPINVTSIEIEKISNYIWRLTWKPPVIDKCSMLPVQYYHVRIISSEGEIISEEKDNATTLMLKCLDNHLNITFTVNITVVNIKGVRSASSVVMKTIVNENSKTVSETSTNKSDEEKCEIFIGMTVVFLATSIITTAVIVILSWKLCSEKRKSDYVSIPAPARFQGQLNVDNIEMQSSPAYVSLDNKSPQLYQNI